jgi:hypothetical protein
LWITAFQIRLEPEYVIYNIIYKIYRWKRVKESAMYKTSKILVDGRGGLAGSANAVNSAYRHGVKKLLNPGSSCIYPRPRLTPPSKTGIERGIAGFYKCYRERE